MELTRSVDGQISTSGSHISIPIIGLFENSLDESISIIQVGQPQAPLKGHISNGCVFHNHPSERFNASALHPAAKVKLTFIQNVNSETPNNIIYDYIYSHKDGAYYAFLEEGEYKVRVDAPGQQFFFSQTIPSGLKEYYFYPESASIKGKIEDTILLYGTSKVLVVGCLINEYNNPHSGQIIISKDDQLVTFIDSKNGKYSFLIDYGIYDIRLRSLDRSVRIYHNFKFSPGKGFFTELAKHRIRGFDDDTINQLIENNQLYENLLENNYLDYMR